MEVKTWVLVGSFRPSIWSLALDGRSVLSDWTSSFMPAFTRSSRPTRLPFLPFPFSSGIAYLFLGPCGDERPRPSKSSEARQSNHSYADKYAPSSLNCVG